MSIEVESIVIYIYPIFIILMILEYVLAKQFFDLKESASGFAIAAVASLVAFFSKAFALVVFIYIFELFRELRLGYLGYESVTLIIARR